MAARCGVVRWWRDEEKGNGPVPTVRCLGRPVSVCVCLCVPLRCCVGGACVKGEDKGFLIYFFFTSLFSLSPPPPQSPHPYDTRRRGTPALSTLFLVAVHKGTPPPRRGEKSPRDDTYFSYNISVPLVGRYSVFDFYSFPNVGRDWVVVFPTTLNHHLVRSVIHHACR